MRENKNIMPPETYPFENALLSLLLNSSEYISEAKRIVSEDTFASQQNKDVWSVLSSLDAAGARISAEDVYLKVADKKHFVENIMSGETYGTFSEFRSRLAALVEASIRRRAYFVAQRLLDASVNSVRADDLLKIAEDFTTESVRVFEKEDSVSVNDAVNALGDVIAKRESDRAEGKRLRVPTSIRQLDFVTYGGFANGNLVVVAARPSVGKTAISMQMARAAAGSGIPAMFFSLEMTNVELAQRLLCSTHLIDSMSIARGEIQWTDFERAAGQVGKLKLWLNDSVSELDEIISRIRTAHKQGKCDVAFIDYLGLMSFRDDKRPLYQQLAEATKRLKKLAKDCDLPIVLLCQLNRDMSKEGRAPELHDLRDSGSIEQDADIVLMLERERNDDATLSNRINAYVRKNRQGRAGDKIQLLADDSYTNFTEQWQN